MTDPAVGASASPIPGNDPRGEGAGDVQQVRREVAAFGIPSDLLSALREIQRRKGKDSMDWRSVDTTAGDVEALESRFPGIVLDPEGYLQIGNLHLATVRENEAIWCYERAAALRDDRIARRNRAIGLALVRRFAEARLALGEFRDDPEVRPIHAALAEGDPGRDVILRRLGIDEELVGADRIDSAGGRRQQVKG